MSAISRYINAKIILINDVISSLMMMTKKQSHTFWGRHHHPCHYHRCHHHHHHQQTSEMQKAADISLLFSSSQCKFLSNTLSGLHQQQHYQQCAIRTALEALGSQYIADSGFYIYVATYVSGYYILHQQMHNYTFSLNGIQHKDQFGASVRHYCYCVVISKNHKISDEIYFAEHYPPRVVYISNVTILVSE